MKGDETTRMADTKMYTLLTNVINKSLNDNLITESDLSVLLELLGTDAQGGLLNPKQQIKATLEPAGWTGSAFPYLYTINIENLSANAFVLVHADMGLTLDQINAFSNASITANSQAAGKIVLQAVVKPSIQLPIVIEVGDDIVAKAA